MISLFYHRIDLLESILGCSIKCTEFKILFRKINNNTDGYIWHAYEQ